MSKRSVSMKEDLSMKGSEMQSLKAPLPSPGVLRPEENAEAAVALVAQYRKALAGMREVLLFGAMLMQLRAALEEADSLRGGKQGLGLKAWLAEHTPEISRETAYRFLGVAEGVAVEYAGVVGKRVAEKIPMPELVLAAPEALPEPARLKQQELFEYVQGTSQRSWLDIARSRARREPPAPRGAGADGAASSPDPQGNGIMVARKMAYGAELAELVSKLRGFVLERKLHAYLDAAEVEQARLALQDVCRGLK